MSTIPVPDVTEDLPNDRASMRQFITDPGPGNPGATARARAVQSGLRQPVQAALASEARAQPPGVQQTGPNSFSQAPGSPGVDPAARPAGFANPGAPDVNPTKPNGFNFFGEAEGGARNPAAMLRAAGTATGQGIADAGSAAVNGIRGAGAAVGKAVVGNAGYIADAVGATAGHGNAYFDPNVPLTDKLRMGATDLTSIAGGAAGGIFGGAAGSVAGPVGTFVGGAAGGAAGVKGGHSLGNAIFGGDDALTRNGYNADRNIVDVGSDLIHGKGADSFGIRTPQAGAGRGSINPPMPSGPTDAPNPAAPQVDNGSTNLFAGQAPSAAAQPPAVPGGIRRIGNSFTDGSTAPASANGFGVSTIGNGAAGNPTASSQDVIDAARRLDAFGAGAHNADGSGGSANLGGAGPQIIDRNAVSNDAWARQQALQQGLRSSDRGVRAQAMAGIAAGNPDAIANRTIGSNERIAGIREQGETLRANALNHSNAIIHANDNEVSLRNNQTTNSTAMAGHQATAQLAGIRLMQEQQLANRTYDAGRADAANSQAQIAHQNAVEAIPRVSKEFEGMIPPGADGKPDTATAARYAQGLATAMPLIRAAANPAKQAALDKGGVDALDAGDKARIVAGMQLSDVANATATGGLTPWGTRAISSNQPILAIRKQANGDYITNRRGVNGESEVIPGRYIEKEGSTLGIGGRASDKFKALME